MTGAEIVPVVAALIAGGTFTRIAAWIGAKRKARSPEGRQAASLATLDQSIAVVARARDELEEDNRRLREELADERTSRAAERAQHAEERAQWSSERAAMRAEIIGLETRLRDMLSEVEDLKRRHA